MSYKQTKNLPERLSSETIMSIYEKYDLVFRNGTPEISIPFGWQEIFEEFLEDISLYLMDKQEHKLKIQQIKSKMGAVRVYYNITDEYVAKAIEDFSKKSSTTCSICGCVRASVKVLKHGLFKTLCDAHSPADAMTEQEYNIIQYRKMYNSKECELCGKHQAIPLIIPKEKKLSTRDLCFDCIETENLKNNLTEEILEYFEKGLIE